MDDDEEDEDFAASESESESESESDSEEGGAKIVPEDDVVSHRCCAFCACCCYCACCALCAPRGLLGGGWDGVRPEAESTCMHWFLAQRLPGGAMLHQAGSPCHAPRAKNCPSWPTPAARPPHPATVASCERARARA